MAYTEYFDTGSSGNTHTNYNNSGAVHSNYNNSGVAHSNYYNSGASHANYSNLCSPAGHFDTATQGSNYYNSCAQACSVSHYNYNNVCANTHYNYNNVCANTHYNYNNVCNVSYSNHWNYTSTNKGTTVVPLTWSSPWGGAPVTLTATYIQESVEAIKQLRNNIKTVAEQKTFRATGVPVIDADAASPNTGDSIFNDSNSTTTEKVDDITYDALRASLNNLWSTLGKAGSPSLPDKNLGDSITKDDITNMAQKTSSAATENAGVTYGNHFNTTYNLGTYTPS